MPRKNYIFSFEAACTSFKKSKQASTFVFTHFQPNTQCSLQKGTSLDKAMLNSEEVKPVDIAIIELRLSEGISK